ADQIYTLGQMLIGVIYASLVCFFIGLVWKRVNPAENENGVGKPLDRSGLSRIITIGAIGILIIILIDMWPMKAHFNPFVEKKNMYFDTVTTEFLQERLEWNPGDDDGPYRFGRSWKEILQPNTGMMYGLDDFGGYDSNLIGNYGKLLTTVDETILMGVHFIETPRYRQAFTSNVWNMLGVKYVLAHRGHFGQFEPVERWQPLYYGEVLILENRDALPRMHLVDQFTWADPDEALELSSEIDPASEAVVSRHGSGELIEFESNGESPGTVVITEYLPEKVTASVTCERPAALLCFYDSWFPGWDVKVDGISKPLEQVNYAFKGVFVEEGDHVVVFSYRPRSLVYGIIGTIIGILLMLLIAKPLSKAVGWPGN
ncbi:YfhO family protein, partial [bacterium]|nr:YfhO family protein [bacterium]